MRISSLHPVNLWKYFEEICQIPRASGKEESMIAYLEAFARHHKLAYKKDHIGNVLINKPASPLYEQSQGITLQCHLDMVIEKNVRTDHDFDHDPIEPVIKENWVKAKGTTLGADDGIGIAAVLAILSSDKIEHPALECLFTVEEETGLTGAKNMKPGFFKGKMLINLDSEDEGEIFIGCAGGIDTVGELGIKREKIYDSLKSIQIDVSGLIGGHSGDDIHKGRANSIKILTRLLWQLKKQCAVRLHSLSGGNLRNAIPREAKAIISIQDNEDEVISFLEQQIYILHTEHTTREPGLQITMVSLDPVKEVFTRAGEDILLNLLYALPHGVYAWSQEMENLVETSTNLASVKEISSRTIEITTSQRSSRDSAKVDISAMVTSAVIRKAY